MNLFFNKAGNNNVSGDRKTFFGRAIALFKNVLPIIRTNNTNITAEVINPEPAFDGDEQSSKDSIAAGIIEIIKEYIKPVVRKRSALIYARLPNKEELINKINTALLRLKNSLSGVVETLSERLASLRGSYALRQPMNMVTQRAQEIDDLKKDLSLRIDHILKMRAENFGRLTGKMEALNPLAILNRGYSVTERFPSGDIIKDSAALAKGDIIKTRLGKGIVKSKVEEVG